MTSAEAVAAFFKDRKDRARRDIETKAINSNTDAFMIAHAKNGTEVDLPMLEMTDKEAKSILEVPEYTPSSFGGPITVGAQYDGVEVIIPVSGNFDLFLTITRGRYICEGFVTGNRRIRIKQYDFARVGTDGIKRNIKEAVEGLIAELESLKPLKDTYLAELDTELAEALAKRRKVIADKAQKDKDADPWG